MDDPKNLIGDCEFAIAVVEDLLIPEGHDIGDNCVFEVTAARVIAKM